MDATTITIASAITIVNFVIGIITFANNRKEKSNKEVEGSSYRQGVLDQQLKNIFEKLEKIENKLDSYDTEIEEKVQKALEIHIKQYHDK